MNKIFSLILILISLPLLLIISVLIVYSSGRPVLHWSKRIGKNNKEFFMPKFRTMKNNTPQKATHLMLDEENYITGFGSFLRKTSLDEVPQLFSILRGQMNFIGPRPALFNQHDLMRLRILHGIDKQKPGITGWAQVNGRDNLSIEEKIKVEKYYYENKSLNLQIKILIMTLIKLLKRDQISH